MEKFCVHFDVKNHYITADEFVQTIKSIKLTCNDFNKNILNNQLEFEIVVLPSEDGSYKLKVGVITLGAATIMLQGVVSDFGKGFITELTGNNPEYYGVQTCKFMKDGIKTFFRKSNAELRKIIPDQINLDASIKAKSDFYQMCLSSEEIKAIGFDNSEKFSIKRAKFYDYISDDIIRSLPSDYLLQELLIIKPVIIDSNAKWYLKDNNIKELPFSAYINDESFRSAFLLGHYPLKKSKSTDKILAQVEYEKELINGFEKIKNINIIEVYSFNKKKIKTVPDHLILNKPVTKVNNNGQLNLFRNFTNELE